MQGFALFYHPLENQCLLVYHGIEPDQLLRPPDQLDGEAVVPNFAVEVAQLFEEWDF